MRRPAQLAALRAFAARHRLVEVAYLAFVVLMVVVNDDRIYRDFFYVTVIPLFLLVAADRWRDPLRSPVWWLSAALLAYLCLTLLWVPPSPVRTYFDGVRCTILILLFVTVTATLAMEPGFPRRLFVILAGVAAAAGAVLVIRYFAAGLFPARLLEGPGALRSPNVAAGVYGLVATGLIGWGLWPGGSRSARLGCAVLLALLAPFILLVGSRTTLVACAAALLVGCALARRWLPVVALALLSVLYGALLLLHALPAIGLVERGDSYRFLAWRTFWDLAMQHPWLGYGRTFDLRQMAGGVDLWHPHNIYLAAQLLGGLPATLLLVALLAAAARAGWRRWRRAADPAPLLLVTFLAVHGWFEHGSFIHNANWEWLHLWMPLGVIAGLEIAGKRGPPPAPPDQSGRAPRV
ncbi:MAG: O-antigen ligase family protein [Dongiaceae bacterium]